jgi:hypothetical protein
VAEAASTPGFNYAWIVVIGLGIALRFCSSVTDGSNAAPPSYEVPAGADYGDTVDAAYGQTTPPQVENDFRRALDALLGAGYDEAELRNTASNFLAGLRTAYIAGRGAAGDHEAGIAAARNHARSYIIAARLDAEFAELVAIAEMRRVWLRALRDQGLLGAQCPLRTSIGGEYRDVVLDEAGQAREQALLRQLASVRLFETLPQPRNISASVPGEVIGGTMERSGLSEDVVRAALGDFDHPERCRMELGMLDTVLARPGEVSADLLRVI